MNVLDQDDDGGFRVFGFIDFFDVSVKEGERFDQLLKPFGFQRSPCLQFSLPTRGLGEIGADTGKLS